MENAAKRLTTRGTVLLITDASGGRVEGRMVMQKLAYFSGLGLGTTLGHRAHYYGPYSSKVEDALNLATVAGDLDEMIERVPGWPEVVKYTYSLTDHGRAKVEQLRQEHPCEWERILAAVQAIKGAIPDLNQKMLASAAKTYLIASESEQDVSEEGLLVLARQLGWMLTGAEVERTIDIFKRLGLVMVESEPAAPLSQTTA